MSPVPIIDVSALFGPANDARAETDRQFLAAADTVGFVRVRGLPSAVDLSARRRAALKRIFGLPLAEQKLLWRRKFDPARSNVYRGWFPVQSGHETYKEGIDMGPDVARVPNASPTDPLCEATPLPSDESLPGWRAEVRAHYLGLEEVGRKLMRSLARGLAIDETFFDSTFEGGISTMRLLRYPPRPQTDDHELAGAAHVDSGLLTLLLQDEVPGLQVKNRQGEFENVPVADGELVVNFGRLLQLWTGGHILATEHRVLSGTEERYSFPFFYEPRVDGLISPIPSLATDFEPFYYGDFLWRTATHFVEFHGLEALRTPTGSVPEGF